MRGTNADTNIELPYFTCGCKLKRRSLGGKGNILYHRKAQLAIFYKFGFNVVCYFIAAKISITVIACSRPSPVKIRNSGVAVRFGVIVVDVHRHGCACFDTHRGRTFISSRNAEILLGYARLQFQGILRAGECHIQSFRHSVLRHIAQRHFQVHNILVGIVSCHDRGFMLHVVAVGVLQNCRWPRCHIWRAQRRPTGLLVIVAQTDFKVKPICTAHIKIARCCISTDARRTNIHHTIICGCILCLHRKAKTRIGVATLQRDIFFHCDDNLRSLAIISHIQIIRNRFFRNIQASRILIQHYLCITACHVRHIILIGRTIVLIKRTRSSVACPIRDCNFIRYEFRIDLRFLHITRCIEDRSVRIGHGHIQHPCCRINIRRFFAQLYIYYIFFFIVCSSKIIR